MVPLAGFDAVSRGVVHWDVGDLARTTRIFLSLTIAVHMQPLFLDVVPSWGFGIVVELGHALLRPGEFVIASDNEPGYIPALGVDIVDNRVCGSHVAQSYRGCGIRCRVGSQVPSRFGWESPQLASRY